MDIKETFNQLDNTKFNDFNNRLEGFRFGRPNKKNY